MASGHFSHNDSLGEVKHRFKFAFRSLLVLPLMLQWLKTFLADPALLDYLRRNPRVAAKLHRPYLSQKLGGRAKLATLEAHYRLECLRMPPHCLQALLHNQDLQLALLHGRDEQNYRIVLTHAHSFDKEGELSLQLRNTGEVALVTLTFSFDEDSRGSVLVIGGLQGPRRALGNADSIRAATKAFSGLFPKRLLMEALTALARELGIDRIEAVEKAQHIYNSWRYRRHFEADYDSFWFTLGAETTQTGRIHLPDTLARKSMEDIASKKRAEYQRRYTLLDAVDAQIANLLGTDGIPAAAGQTENLDGGPASAFTAR